MAVTFEFGPFSFDAAGLRVLRDGEPLLLPPKAAEVLRVLIERRGAVVDKDDLMAIVWSDTIVEDANLTQAIFMLRKALGDSRSEPQYIATVARRGYRFLAEVHKSLEPSTAVARAPEQRGTVGSLAVLPFSLLGVGPEDEYLGLGLADAIITRLSNIPGIVVRPTSSIRQHAEPAGNLFALGRALRVDAIVEGTIQRLQDRVRMTVQLVNVRSGAPVWAERFEERFTDIFALQDAVAHRVATSLVARLTGDEQARLARRETQNIDAHRAYLKGRYYWNRRSADALHRAVACFKTAIDLDQDYVLAYAGLADCYVILGSFGWMMAREAASLGKAAALKALELDDCLADAHSSLGSFKASTECDWSGAERAFRSAIDLAPNDGKTRNWYANCLAAIGRLDEALEQASKAVDLDPLNLTWNMGVGHMLYLARRFDAAIEQELRTLEIDEQFSMAHWILALSYEQTGRIQESVESIARADRCSGGNPLIRGLHGRACALAGRTEEAHTLLRQHLAGDGSGYVAPDAVAFIYAGLRQTDAAFEWLDRAVDHGCFSMTFAAVSPLFDSLRSDPRFTRLLRRLRLI